MAGLVRFLHEFLRIHDAPEFTKIYRHSHGIPQYHCNHDDILAAVDAGESRHPGLTFAGGGHRGIRRADSF